MDDVVTVAKDGQTYALFFRRGMEVDGARFLTPDEATLQVGYFNRSAGYEVKPHCHTESDVHIRTYAEFLYIESGKAQVTIYDDEWNVLAEQVVEGGDFLLFLRGGHGVEVLEPTRFIEVKQGPYPGDGDAKIFRDPT